MRIVHTVIACAFLASATASATIDWEGHRITTFLDATLGRFEFSRSYASSGKQTTTGLFGVGWGADDLELRLERGPGDTLWLTNGVGGRSTLTPRSNDAPSVEDDVAELMSWEASQGLLSTEALRRRELEALRAQQWLRIAKWRDCTPCRSLRHLPMSLGRWDGPWNSRLNARRLEGGFEVRLFTDVFSFDGDGRVLRLQRPGTELAVERRADGTPLALVADRALRLEFEVDAEGRVVRAELPDGGVANFEYTNGRLTRSLDVAGNLYAYAYGERDELTEIFYAEGRPQAVSYYEETGRARSEVRGEETTWCRFGEEDDGGVWYTWVEKTGSRPFTRRDRWVSNTGAEHTRIAHGEVLWESWTDDRGRLTRFDKGAESMTFTWDDQFRWRAIDFDGRRYEAVYEGGDHRMATITRSGRLPLVARTTLGWNPQGQLVSLESGGVQAKLEYDAYSRLHSVVVGEDAVTFDRDERQVVGAAGKRWGADELDCRRFSYDHWDDWVTAVALEDGSGESLLLFRDGRFRGVQLASDCVIALSAKGFELERDAGAP